MICVMSLIWICGWVWNMMNYLFWVCCCFVMFVFLGEMFCTFSSICASTCTRLNSRIVWICYIWVDLFGFVWFCSVLVLFCLFCINWCIVFMLLLVFLLLFLFWIWVWCGVWMFLLCFLVVFWLFGFCVWGVVLLMWVWWVIWVVCLLLMMMLCVCWCVWCDCVWWSVFFCFDVLWIELCCVYMMMCGVCLIVCVFEDVWMLWCEWLMVMDGDVVVCVCWWVVMKSVVIGVIWCEDVWCVMVWEVLFVVSVIVECVLVVLDGFWLVVVGGGVGIIVWMVSVLLDWIKLLF